MYGSIGASGEQSSGAYRPRILGADLAPVEARMILTGNHLTLGIGFDSNMSCDHPREAVRQLGAPYWEPSQTEGRLVRTDERSRTRR